MPRKRCLVESCKEPAKRVFRIPSEDVVGHEIRRKWLEIVDSDNRTNLGDPYGICANHFSADCFEPDPRDKQGRPLKKLVLRQNSVPTIVPIPPASNVEHSYAVSVESIVEVRNDDTHHGDIEPGEGDQGP